MPIYAYKCSACGYAKDALQKISDTPLTVCPACGASAFTKQVTAAGFQLKGTGWYVTDFRGGNGGAAPANSTPSSAPSESSKSGPPDSGGSAKKSDAAVASAASVSTAPSAPAPVAPAAD
ncbi:MAG: zinc ribbon domain-containing protein [Burkholderiaceae bacterium]|jgi:putative FmdB family regulatory protein|nr:zinc ribbon domain-containing protein [Burkholderiaceae bacterium]